MVSYNIIAFGLIFLFFNKLWLDWTLDPGWSEILAFIIIFITWLVMMILTFLEPLLWLILRLILLIIIFILLAIELITMAIEFLVLGCALFAISSLIDLNMSFGMNWNICYGEKTIVGFLKLEVLGKDFQMDGCIEWIYWEYFDLYVPSVIENIIYDGIVILSDKYELFSFEEDKGGGDDETEYNNLPSQASESPAPPILSDQSFFNTTSDMNEFEFRVRYFDANFEEPDPYYGIRLYLIAPNGTSLKYYKMDLLEENPDYSDIEGILFNYTVDIGNYEQGLWHYYFTVNDSATGKVVFYPDSDYFVGPYTSEGRNSLRSTRISTDPTIYYDADGWIDTDFNFFVIWWDLFNNSAPLNVTLCLIPAMITEGSGISETKGIRKFEMLPVDQNPDYTGPVEYNCSVNFNDLGYNNSNIGLFHHYFEAVTNSSEVIDRLNADENGLCHIYGPLLRSSLSSSSNIDMEIEFHSSEAHSTLLWEESGASYDLVYYDSSGEGPSETPQIIFKKDGEIILQEDMTSCYKSSDGTERRYYYEVDSNELGTGKCQVLMQVKDQDQNEYNPLESLNISTIYVLGSIVEGMLAFNSFSVVLSILNCLFATPVAAAISSPDKVKLLNNIVLGASIATLIGSLVGLLILGSSSMVLGFSIACLMTLIAMTLIKTVDNKKSKIMDSMGKFSAIIDWVKAKGKFIATVLVLISLALFCFSFVFPPYAIYQDWLNFLPVINIFQGIIGIFPSIFAILCSLIPMAIAFSSYGDEMHYFSEQSHSYYGKGGTQNAMEEVQKTIKRYKKILFIIMFVGFIAYLPKLALEFEFINFDI